MSVVILLVEDHEFLRRSLRGWLQVVFAQCHVVEAASGEEAINIVKKLAPRVIIMDVDLPGMNGLEATARIKAIVPAAQIVVLTIHEAEAYRADAKASGASAYVPKNMMLTELEPALAKLLPPHIS